MYVKYIQKFENAGREYARVWKDDSSNPETQTPEALRAAALQEVDAFWTDLEEEFEVEEYRDALVSAFIRGFSYPE